MLHLCRLSHSVSVHHDAPSVLQQQEGLAGACFIIIYKAKTSISCASESGASKASNCLLNSSTLYHSWQSEYSGVEKSSMYRKTGIVKEREEDCLLFLFLKVVLCASDGVFVLMLQNQAKVSLIVLNIRQLQSIRPYL